MRFISRIKRFCCRWKSARRFFSLVFISFVTSSCPIKNPLFFTTICAFSTANVIALNAAYVSRNFSLRLISFSLLAFSFLDQILSLFVFFFRAKCLTKSCKKSARKIGPLLSSGLSGTSLARDIAQLHSASRTYVM